MVQAFVPTPTKSPCVSDCKDQEDNLKISERAEAIESPRVIGIPEWN